MTKRLLIILFLFVFKPSFCQDKTKCDVYLIRPGDYFLNGAKIKIQINDTLKIKLKDRSYQKIKVNAGTFKISYQLETLTQNLQQGKTYYYTFAYKAGWRAKVKCFEVTEESGLKKINILDKRKKSK